MELFVNLEEKIQVLIGLAQELKLENKRLLKENESFLEEIKLLKVDNAGLVEENLKVAAQLKAVEEAMIRENKLVDVLSQEKTATKLVVDDLIKSIETLVEREL